MIASVVMWLLFGAIVGWIASLIMKTRIHQGIIANIVVGIVGALLGGSLFRLLGGPSITGFNFMSIFIAIIGAVILLFFVRLLNRNHRRSLL
ncbi:MAG: GlsB/YeaQ/YmgE family stress response membrane protein [Candidatus Saccharimonadales bacterium]